MLQQSDLNNVIWCAINETATIDKNLNVMYISTMKGNSEGYEKTSFSSETEVYFIYHSKDFLDTVIKANGLKIVECREQLFPQEDTEDLIDMIYILQKSN